MNAPEPTRRLAAEFLGAGLLVAAVVGSGIMAANLSEDVGLQLLINMVSTVLALGVLIWALGPISGAHFNPAVTLVAAWRRELAPAAALAYIAAQVAGGLGGVALANLMFGLPAWEASSTERTGSGVLLGEVVATAGLLWVIGTLARTDRNQLGPVLVPAWIGAAYFFTSSTSFANPAVTIGRAFTDTFAGIAPASVLPFLAAQLVGAAVGAGLVQLLYPTATAEPVDTPQSVHSTGGDR